MAEISRAGYMKRKTRRQKETKTSSKLPFVEPSVKWRGRDLGANGVVLLYRGRIYVRPIGRGVVLEDLELQPQFDEILPEGSYEVEFRINRRLPSQPSPVGHGPAENSPCREK